MAVVQSISAETPGSCTLDTVHLPRMLVHTDTMQAKPGKRQQRAAATPTSLQGSKAHQTCWNGARQIVAAQQQGLQRPPCCAPAGWQGAPEPHIVAVACEAQVLQVGHGPAVKACHPASAVEICIRCWATCLEAAKCAENSCRTHLQKILLGTGSFPMQLMCWRGAGESHGALHEAQSRPAAVRLRQAITD